MSGKIGEGFNLDGGGGGKVRYVLAGVPEMALQPGGPARRTAGEVLLAEVRERTARENAAAQAAGPTAVQSY
jgi:hypothetical protein